MLRTMPEGTTKGMLGRIDSNNILSKGTLNRILITFIESTPKGIANGTLELTLLVTA